MLVAAFVGGSGFGVQPKADVGAATIADNSIAADPTALVPQNGTMEAIAPHAQETQQAVADIRYQPPIPSGATVTVQAAGRGKPYLNLTDGREMQVEYVGDGSLREALQSGQARARALASADLDGNGTPDLIAGYAYDGGGIVTIQRGNPDAFAPKDDSVFVRMQQGYNPDSLLPQTETYQVPGPADFVQVGDFNHDNRKDVLVGTRGGDLFLLPGEGDGRLGLPEQVSLPGKVTALAAGEFRAADGWPDIVVGVVGADGPSLLIFDGVGGVKGEPMTFRLSAPATAVEIAGLDNDPFRDVAVAAGNEVLIIHGWGRKQPVDLSSRVEHINLSQNARDLAVGFFLWNRAGSDQIAVLQDDGTVNILDQAGSDTRPFTPAEIALFRESRGNAKRENVDVESWPSWQPLAAASWTSVRQYAANSSLAAQALSQKVLMRSHLSFQETDDLMLLDDSWQKVNIVHQADRNAGVKSAAPFTDDLTTISLDVTGAPTAALALPQKLNGERSLLMLQAGSPSPIEMSLHTAATITVDRTDDPSGAALAAASVCGAAANDCSLRGAIQFANANPGSTITLPAGTYTLTTAGGGGGGCDGNTSGDLGINASTTITGAGSATTIILQNGTNPATNQDRIMCLNEAFALNFAYNFSGITISGGRDNTSFGGAGIVAGEKGNSLTLTNVVLSNNQSSGANVGGGALQILGGDLTLTNCTIGGTSAPGAFGARSNSAADLAKGNLQSTASGAVGFDPSAPQHDASTGILTVTGTTFSHNTAGNNGGALDTFTSSFNGHTAGTGSFSISTSTFSNNAATTNDGGAFINESFNGSIATTSFTSNSAGGHGGALKVGGGTGTTLDGTSASLTFAGSNTATGGGTSISTASTVNVAGTNTTIGGSIEVTSGGVWNNNGATFNPTDISVLGGTFNCNTGTMNVSGNLLVDNEAVKGGTFNLNSGTVNLNGNLTVSGVGTPLTSFNGGTGNFNFTGAGAQSINADNAPTFTFANLTVNKSSGTLTANTSVSVVGGNLAVTAGTFDMQGNTFNRSAAGGTLTVSNGAFLKIGGAQTLPSNYSTHSIGATSTIEYEGTSQTVATLNSAQNYGNLTISGSGTKTLQGATTVASNLIINGGTLDVSASNFALNVGGNFTNNVAAANFNPRAGTVTFNGATAQNINGTATSHTFTGLTSNRTGTGDLSLGSNVTVNGLLTLTSGNILTNANTLFIGSGGTRSRASGYIIGKENKTYGGAGSFTFDVGTANGYSPVDSTTTAGTGDLTVLAVQGAQPSVVSSRSLQRYWTLTEGGAGITANLVFHYLDPGDVMGVESNYQPLQVTSGARTYFTNSCPTTCVDGAANTFTVSGITNFSDFTAGEARADLQITSNTDSPDPVIVSNNITYTINFINNGPDTSTNVTVTDPVPANTTFVSVTTPVGWSRTDSVTVGGTGNIVFSKASVTSGESASFTVVVKVNAGAVGGSTISNTATAASAITTDPTPGNDSATATTLVHTPPVITSANNVTFVVGTAGSFTVTTTGFPAPSIARGGVALPSGVTFLSNGDGTGTLSGTPAATTGGTYAITFTATNAAGSTPAQNFTLTVNEAPYVTTQPTAATKCAGQNASFTAAAGGFPVPTIQWQVSVSAGPFNNLSGETSGTLNVNGVTVGQNGNQYRAVFTNVVTSTNSNAALLTVNALPSTPTITPNPTAVDVNSVGNQASGPTGATTYAWTITNGTITSATNIQTITYSASTGGNVHLGLTVTNASGCSAGNSLDVPTKPLITSISKPSNVPTIVFTTLVGRNYTVERKDDLLAATWTAVTSASNLAGNGSTLTVTDPDPGAGSLPKRFYNVVLLP